MPDDQKTISEAALQTLDVLQGVVSVLEKMWSSNVEATYNIQLDPEGNCTLPKSDK